MSNAVLVDIPSPGEYSLRLQSSDFKENANNSSPQQHVVVHGDATYGDNRTFALNGIGDTETLYCENNLRLFFIDTLLTDNIGSSTVELLQGISVIDTFTIDCQNNAIGGSDVYDNGVLVEFPAHGEYKFTLKNSDFKESTTDTSTQSHVVIWANSSYGDNRTFTLNGVGDSKIIYCSDAVRLLFVDGDPWSDNYGSSTIEVLPVPEPATLLLLVLGGLLLKHGPRKI